MALVTYSQYSGLEVEINRVHDDEHLLIFVRQTIGLAQSGFTEVLHPAMFAEEGRR